MIPFVKKITKFATISICGFSVLYLSGCERANSTTGLSSVKKTSSESRETIAPNQNSAAFDKMADKMTGKFSTPIIRPADLQKRLAKDASKYVLVDTREAPEYSVSHLPNAIHVGYNKFDLKTFKAKVPTSKTVVVYCSVGYRSGDIGDQLIKAGYKAENLHGGLFAWFNQGNVIVDSKNKPTKKVHGYNSSWGKWLTRGDIVY